MLHIHSYLVVTVTPYDGFFIPHVTDDDTEAHGIAVPILSQQNLESNTSALALNYMSSIETLPAWEVV